ncbi:MAG: sugar phosphate isomerase/epimerase [Chloroflexi bacterium]|nr:sugar phosphate isomerase/epimerase [Chloroflexota bacterium]
MGPWVEPEGSEATVQLLAEGALVAQAALPPLAPGSAFTAVVDVPDTLQGLMLRLVAADGAPIPRLGPWHRRLGTDLQIALPQGAATYVPLGGEMIFLGLGDPPERATPGQTVSLRPRFVAARPLLADYSVSVGLSRPDLDWERKSDGTPARGAIPTLKWIRGWQVEDPRELALPPDAPPGPARVTLAVYDAFTLHPLQVLDDRLARQGLGTHLEPADIEIVHPRRALNRARLSLAAAHQQPPLPAGRQGGSPRDRQPVIEFVALSTDAAALDRPRGLATIVALTFAAPDSRRRPRQTERGSVMEGGITMQLSCLPISLFQDIIGGRMSVGEWAQMGAEIGLDAIDISILFVPDRSPQALKRMRREIEASGIGLAMVTTYSDFTHPDPAQRKRELALEQEVIEVAAALGARFVRVTAGQAHPQTGREEGIAWAVEGIRKLHETSGALGPRLLFENHAKPGAWEYHDFAQPSDIFLEIVRATEDIGLGVNFDTGNAASFDDDPVGLLGQVIDRVVTIHAADTCVKGELRHCALGTGIAPFAEVFRFLHRAGWDNWICIEEEAHQGRKGIEADARFVREAWEAART